jgi:hypothetical protein
MCLPTTQDWRDADWRGVVFNVRELYVSVLPKLIRVLFQPLRRYARLIVGYSLPLTSASLVYADMELLHDLARDTRSIVVDGHGK